MVERAKLFFFRHFERIFVLLLVGGMVVIHAVIEQKFAFLSFYYLPVILAGFYGGRRFAVVSSLFMVCLVFFYQAVQGLDMLPGFYEGAILALVPWAGFLILTGYVVGMLSEQKEARLAEVKHAYMATLELLAFHIESMEKHQQGHGHRVAALSVAIARQLNLPEEDVENLRVPPCSRVGTRDQRGPPASGSRTTASFAVARAMHGAAEIIGEYGTIRDRRRGLGRRHVAYAARREDPRGSGFVRNTSDGDAVRQAFPKCTQLEEIERDGEDVTPRWCGPPHRRRCPEAAYPFRA